MYDRVSVIAFFNRLSPYIRRAWDGEVYLGWHLNERVIFDYELIYISTGSAVIKVGEQSYEAQTGDLFFLRPLVPHSLMPNPEQPFRQPHIHFDMFYQDNSEEVYVSYWRLDELGRDIQLARDDRFWLSALDIPTKIRVSDPAYVEATMMKIIDRPESADPVDMLRNKATFIELLAYIFSEILDDAGESYKDDCRNAKDIETALERARGYILDHISNNLSIESVAQVAGFSKGYLVKLFKLRYKQSPTAMHTSLRMERAKQMLVYSSMSVTAIAHELGFESIHSFSRAFKENCRTSPKQYRQYHNAQKDAAGNDKA